MENKPFFAIHSPPARQFQCAPALVPASKTCLRTRETLRRQTVGRRANNMGIYRILPLVRRLVLAQRRGGRSSWTNHRRGCAVLWKKVPRSCYRCCYHINASILLIASYRTSSVPMVPAYTDQANRGLELYNIDACSLATK